MGNCLNGLSSAANPSLSSPFSSTLSFDPANPNVSMVSPASVQLQDLPFTPILPFDTSISHANLHASYVLGSELGRGQTGIIRTCTSRSSGAVFACKSISKLRLCTYSEVENVVREVRILKHLSLALHSHASKASLHSGHAGSIVRLYDIIEDKESVHLIMELCSGGELFDRIVRKKCYPEVQAAYIIKSLLEIVQFCHSKGILHRDIKPENILLVEDSDTSPIKLADFGLALEFSSGQKFCGIAGSSYYIAPEVLQGDYSEEVDIWSIGVILYLLLSGTPPFRGATEQRIFEAIQKGDLKFPSNPWENISTSAKDLITQLLHVDAKLRLTPAQALNHQWILHHSKLSPTKDAENLGLRKAALACSWNRAGNLSNAAQLGMRETLLDVIASKDQSNTHMVSNSELDQKVQSGWTCTLLNLNGHQEAMVVGDNGGRHGP